MNTTNRPLPFVLAASDFGPMIVSRLDFTKNPQGYYGVGFQILHTGAYDRPEMEQVRSILYECRRRRGERIVAIDCGANIGAHTLFMAHEMLDWGEVWAFEAQERLYYALCGNIALNNLFNAHAVFSAVGHHVGTTRIPKVNYEMSGSYGSLELHMSENTEFIGQPISYAEKDLVETPITTIDNLAPSRVDFMKIDVEGMEPDVLAGARETIIKHRPYLLIEWIKCSQSRILDFLVPLGYSCSETGMNIFASPD